MNLNIPTQEKNNNTRHLEYNHQNLVIPLNQLGV